MKAYIDIGTNSLGGYYRMIDILGIDNAWLRLFSEPNPECYEYIDKHIKEDSKTIFFRGAVGGKTDIATLLTRDDMAGDSAATTMGIQFITDSIGSVNQENPSYNKYVVEVIGINSFLDNVGNADEYYIKMDCEGSEYAILNNIKAKHLHKIKRLFVEFHAHNDKMRAERDKLINAYANLNINIENWD